VFSRFAHLCKVYLAGSCSKWPCLSINVEILMCLNMELGGGG
jgi:hypothetical protein